MEKTSVPSPVTSGGDGDAVGGISDVRCLICIFSGNIKNK